MLDGAVQLARGLWCCAAVEFTLKGREGGRSQPVSRRTVLYPVIACNRDETIERVVNELLTAAENVIEVIDGKLRTAPSIRLPQRGVATPKIIDTFDAHIVSGSRRERDGVAATPNILSMAVKLACQYNAYSALAESVCDHTIALTPSGAMNPTTSHTLGSRGRWGAPALARRSWS